MKITFEGNTIKDVFDEIEALLARYNSLTAELQGPGPKAIVPVDKPVDKPVAKPVDKPVDKPVYEQITKSVKAPRTAKQLENDERLRARAKAKKDAGLKPFEKAPARVASDKAAPAPAPEPKPVPPPATAESLGLAPDEVVKVRQKTIEDLQSAYANGFQKEVFELLSRFGNGAKSFRELPPESFVPIREAIDNGALT